MGGDTRGRGWENTLWKSRIWQTCGIRLLCRQRGRSGRGPLETAIRHGERMWELVCWLLFFLKREKKRDTDDDIVVPWSLFQLLVMGPASSLLGFFLMFTWPKETMMLLHSWCFWNGISSELVSVWDALCSATLSTTHISIRNKTAADFYGFIFAF